ncbi:MAG: inositol monophosphatase family protein [Candidatus Undinarchaeales archaeon]
MNWEKFCTETGRDMAGKITEVYGTDKAHVEHGRGKGGDITIEGDKVSEEILLEHLKKLDQKIYLISEEVGHLKLGDFDKPNDADYTILVDPLDGSFNFRKRMDHFAVSIGVLDKNYEPVAGYVRDVPKEIEYYAEKGKGAFSDGEKIETRKDSEKANILLEASPRASRGDIEFLSKAFLNTRRARAYGSVALDLCRVADGTFHSFLYAGCSRYLDITAGLFIVKEAGGIVTDFNGNEQLTKGYNLIAKNILASGNKKVHNKLLKNRPLSKKK